jgi:hypothetical protein
VTLSRRWATALAFFFLFFGQFYPTSIGGGIMRPLIVLHGAIFFGVACLLFLFARDEGQTSRAMVAIGILAVLFAATMLSPFPTITIGTVAGYATFAAMFTVSIRGIGANASNRTLRRMLVVTNVLTIVVGILIILGITPVQQFIVANYSMAYEELVQRMTWKGKPVVTFGSHSIAGFFFYIFFYLNLETRRAGGGVGYMIAAIAYALLEVFLLSVTGILFLLIALAQLLLYATRERAGLRLASFVILGGAAVLGGAWFVRTDAFDALLAVLESQDNGVFGRYSATGTLLPNILYFLEHPLRPLGMSYSNRFYYGDSGIIEYLLRGSIPLVILVYYGLYRFLRDNLRDRSHVRALMGALLLFETGYTVLTYHRLAYLLSFAVLYLFSLPTPSSVSRDATAFGDSLNR